MLVIAMDIGEYFMKLIGLFFALFISQNALATGVLEIKNPEQLQKKMRVDSGNFLDLRKECAENLLKQSLPKILNDAAADYSYQFRIDENIVDQALRDLELENELESSFVGSLEVSVKIPSEKDEIKRNVWFTIMALDYVGFQETREGGYFGPIFTMECSFESNFLSPQNQGFRELFSIEDEKFTKILSVGFKD